MRSNVQLDCHYCGGKISQAQIEDFHEQRLDKMEAGVEGSVTVWNNIALKKMGYVRGVHDFVTISCPSCPEVNKADKLETDVKGKPLMHKSNQLKELTRKMDKVGKKGEDCPCPICEINESIDCGFFEASKTSEGTEYDCSFNWDDYAGGDPGCCSNCVLLACSDCKDDLLVRAYAFVRSYQKE